MKCVGGSMHGKYLPENVDPAARVLGWSTPSPDGRQERYVKRLWMTADGSRLAYMILDSIRRQDIDALAKPVLEPNKS